MAVSTVLRRVIGTNFHDSAVINLPGLWQVQQSRGTKAWTLIEKPKPGIKGKSYRRHVHYPEEYTVEPLQVTNLAGRDPITGRVVSKGLGGGIKHKFHWIHWVRDGPTDPREPPKEEKILAVFKNGCRTADIALVGSGTELRYYLATVNMKPGQIIKTSRAIPRMPVRAHEGDAYPLGAFPNGTIVNTVEKYPGMGGCLIHSAGTAGTIIRRDGTDRVIVQMPSKKLFSLYHTCLATVGRISNIEHGSTPIGSAQRNRELGNRPRSGLWQRKSGRHGRKIRAPPPVKYFDPDGKEYQPETIRLTHTAFNTNADSVRKPTVPVPGWPKPKLRPL